MHSSIGGADWNAKLQHLRTRAQTVEAVYHAVCPFLICTLCPSKTSVLQLALIV